MRLFVSALVLALTGGLLTSAGAAPAGATHSAPAEPVFTREHRVPLADGGELLVTETFSARCWLRHPRRAVLFLAGSAFHGNHFSIPVAGYDGAAQAARRGMFAFTVNTLGETRLSVRDEDAEEAVRIIEAHREQVPGGLVVPLPQQFDALESRLGYRFRDRGLLAYHMNDVYHALKDLEAYLKIARMTEQDDEGRKETEQVWEHVKTLRRRAAQMN